MSKDDARGCDVESAQNTRPDAIAAKEGKIMTRTQGLPVREVNHPPSIVP